MCCHIPGPSAQWNKVNVEKNKAELWWFGKAGLLVADTLWIIKHSCSPASAPQWWCGLHGAGRTSADSLHHKSRRSHRNRRQCQHCGDTKTEAGGGQGGEEKGLAKKDREETEKRANVGGRGKHVNSTLTLSVQTPVNRLLSHVGERPPYRTMETQRNGPAMLQTAPRGWQRLHWRRRPARLCREMVPHRKQKLFP